MSTSPLSIGMCPICFEDLKRPTAFTCGHVYCKECADCVRAAAVAEDAPRRNNAARKAVLCPQCRAPSTTFVELFVEPPPAPSSSQLRIPANEQPGHVQSAPKIDSWAAATVPAPIFALATIKQLRLELDKAETKHRVLSAEMDRQRAERERESAVHSLSASKITAELQSVQARARNIQDDLNRSRSLLSKLARENEQMQDVHKEALAKREAFQNELADLQAENRDLRDSYATITNELERTRESLRNTIGARAAERKKEATQRILGFPVGPVDPNHWASRF